MILISTPAPPPFLLPGTMWTNMLWSKYFFEYRCRLSRLWARIIEELDAIEVMYAWLILHFDIVEQRWQCLNH